MSCSTSEVIVLYDCGATWFQKSCFSQASLVPNSVLIRHVFVQSSYQRSFASTKRACGMARPNIAQRLKLKPRFSRAEFILVQHNPYATFETDLTRSGCPLTVKSQFYKQNLCARKIFHHAQLSERPRPI